VIQEQNFYAKNIGVGIANYRLRFYRNIRYRWKVS